MATTWSAQATALSRLPGSLGWEEIDAVRSDLEGAEMTAFAIADNRTSDLSEWDLEALAGTLGKLSEHDADLALATGWGQHDIDNLLIADWELGKPTPGGLEGFSASEEGDGGTHHVTLTESDAALVDAMFERLWPDEKPNRRRLVVHALTELASALGIDSGDVGHE
jgi:hypothetical protein